MGDRIKLRPEDLSHIREWVQKQPHLPMGIPDDQLKLFMHSCYYKLENTKRAIETYYTMKTSVPEFFDNRSLGCPGIKHILNVCRMCVLPKPTQRGFYVLFAKLQVTEPAQFYLDDAIKLLFMVIDTHLRAQGTAPGMVFLFDMQGVTLGHLTRINLSSVRKYFVYVQEAMPVRLKSIHIINVNPVMTHIMSIIRPFIHKQHLQYIHLHSPEEVKELYEFVPREILPKDYQGEEASLETLTKETSEEVRASADWFKRDEKLRTDESKRQGKTEDTFSIQGSFKKLDID
uniref:CRAL-TRIO domain-containing protein n=1 Tax=Graphocephala atropunctata TaxID=36148 RepID=A0A1B6KMT6_9HEMI